MPTGTLSAMLKEHIRMNEEQYITVTQACELLNISRFKLLRMIRQGQIKQIDDPWDARRKLIRYGDVQRILNGPRATSFVLAS
jgi:excisionase family DNA binding protein